MIFRKRRWLWWVTLLLFLLLTLLLGTLRRMVYQDKVSTIVHTETEAATQQIDLVKNHLWELAETFHKFKIDIPQITDIMAGALHAKTMQKRQALRKELFKLLDPSYKYMKQFGLRQLHFHLPGPVSFLRFHRPSKYGDSLAGVREDLDWVNRNKKPIAAFAEGRIFNGFRNVYPIFKNGEFLGTVEISYSFAALEEELRKADTDASYTFLVKRDVMNRKVFKDEKHNYEPSNFKGFYFDKSTLRKDMPLSLATIYAINRAISPEAASIMQAGALKSILFHASNIRGNRHILVTFVPVKNIRKETVAYIVKYDFLPIIDEMRSNLKLSYFFVTIIALLLTILIMLGVVKYIMVKESSTHDPLTGLFNRAVVNAFFNKYIQESHRYGVPFSAIFCDIDHFKRINDTYGHDVGDLILQALAKMLQQNLRESDVLARWGGEEFIILLPDTKLDQAVTVAEKLREAIDAASFPEVGKKITCSFGVAQLQEGENAQAFFKRVDDYLYKAKKSGRNRVVSA